MKAKKIFAVLCACAIAMFAFTGCSGNDTETTENTTENTTEITSTEASTTDTTEDKTAENISESNADSASFTGTYSPKTVTDSEGTEMTYEEYVSQAAIAQGFEEGSEDYNSFVSSSEAKYVFNDDGTVTASMGEKENSGTYVFDGDSVLTTTFDGVETRYTYDKAQNTLTATDYDTGITIVLSIV